MEGDQNKYQYAWDRMGYPAGQLDVQISPDGDKVSKRTILSAIASLFDPNGYCSPALLPAKRFQGEVWKQGFGWDDELPEELKMRWNAIVLSWKTIEITIPRRCFIIKPEEEIELHGFADASLYGIGFCIYARKENTGETGLLFARALVVSHKSTTKSY